MARISTTGPKGLFQRLVYWLCRREFGRVPQSVQVLARHRQVLGGVVGMERALQKASVVPRHLKGLADVRAATRIGCPFCMDIGSSIVQRHGVTADQIRALPDYETSEHFSELERDVLRLTDAMCDTPAVIPDDLVARLVDALGERGVVELTAVIGWENFRARVNHSLGLQAEGYSTGSVCAVPVPARDGLNASGRAGDASPPSRESLHVAS